MFKHLYLLVLIACAQAAFCATASSSDFDGDGTPDELDLWPTHFAASVDTDSDGAPDFWTSGCDANCQAQSGLYLDAFPSDSRFVMDENKNGIPDGYQDYCNFVCRELANEAGKTTDVPDADKDGILDDIDIDDNNDGVMDADSDSNGLIDVYTIEQLDAIRYGLSSFSRKMSAQDPGDDSGCPLAVSYSFQLVPRCYGYELKNNIDFDTNKNGRFDGQDAYWNNGKGWLPIGKYSARFMGVFEGNGYALEHFQIVNPSGRGSLFLVAENATFRNLALTDFKIQVADGAPLVATILGGEIKGVFVRGELTHLGTNFTYLSGLVGESYHETSISNALVATDIRSSAVGYVSGVSGIGDSFLDANVDRAILVLGQLNSVKNPMFPDNVFGNGGQISQSYWAYDLTQQNTAGVTGAVGATLAQLKCPDAANNTSCIPGVTLYEHWDQEKNAAGEDYWVFSANNQLPALKLKGSIYSYQPQVTANQAPQVRLQFDKNAAVTGDDGKNYFSLRAIVTDPNALNVHALKWDYGSLRPSNTLENGYEFYRPAPGKYKVSLSVTDSGLPALASSTEITLEFKEDLSIGTEPVKPGTDPVKPSPEVQAGALSFNTFLLLLGMVILRRARTRAPF